MAKAKAKAYVTSPGKAKWPHLVTPDTTFNKDGVYSTKLLYSPEEFESSELKKVIDGMVDAKYEEVIEGMKPTQAERVFKQYPYADDLDDEKEETGLIAVNFKSNAGFTDKKGQYVSLKPKLFDPAGNLIKHRVNIGNDSILCVRTTPKAYDMDSTAVIEGKQVKTKLVGVTLYISAVQIRKLVEYGASAEEMGFATDGEAFAVEDTFEDGAETPVETGEGDF